MWWRPHGWGLTRGVAVDRMEVQQRGKRERKPQWTSKSTSSKSSAVTTPQTWQTSWKTSKADPKAPAPAGAFPCPQTPLRSPRMAPDGAVGAGVGPPYRRRPARPSESRLRPLRGTPEGRAPARWGVRPTETAPSNYATSVLRKSRKASCVIFVSLSRNRD